MTARPEGSLDSIVRASLFAAIVYSLFEGLFHYPRFALCNLEGTLAIFPRNLLLFVAVGLAAAAAAALCRRVIGRREHGGGAGALATLVLFPAYFLLFALVEGTGWAYSFLDSPVWIAALVALPVLLLFPLLAGTIRRGGAGRFSGITVAGFFFLNAGYRLANPGRVIRLDPAGVALFAAVVAGHVLLFFLSNRVASLWLDGRGRFRTGRLLILLVAAVVATGVPAIRAARSTPGGEGAEEGRPNVLLVVIDTARRDRFSCYGYARPTTPFLESFARESTLYTHAQTPAPWTMPAHASIFTGLYPSAHGLTWNHLFLGDRQQTLAELFAANGYATLGVCNNPWVNRDNGLAQGFETYLEMWREGTFNPTFYHRLEWFVRRFTGRNDHGATRSRDWIVDWLDHRRPAHRPFFAFLNLMECHLSDDAPDGFHERYLRADYSRRVKTIRSRDLGAMLTGLIRLSDEEWRDYGDIYDGDLSYVDSVLGSLIGELERRGLLERTIVVITADHGEHLGEHGMIDHQLSLYEPLLQVPLLIYVPEGMPVPGRSDEPVQTVDIFPTLVDLAGLREGPSHPVQGESLLDPGPRRAFTISEYRAPEAVIRDFLEAHPGKTDILKYRRDLRSLTLDSFKYIWHSNGNSELYDLSKDPGELDDLRERRPGRAAAMEATLEGWMSSFEAGKPEPMRRDLDPETRQRLKALGYVE